MAINIDNDNLVAVGHVTITFTLHEDRTIRNRGEDRAGWYISSSTLLYASMIRMLLGGLWVCVWMERIMLLLTRDGDGMYRDHGKMRGH